MVKQTKITMNLEGLDDLKNQLDRGYITRVGVLGGKNARGAGDPYGNADIGAVHEFGSESAGIPPRSFLRMPLEHQKPELLKAMSAKSVKDAIARGDIKRVFELLGVKGEEIVQKAFSTGGFGQWPALKAETVRRKGSSAILIETAQLRRAVTSDVVGKDEQ